MNARRNVEGVAAVIERDGKLLVICRAEGIAAGGWWCFPGGAIQDGESQQQALVREIREEIGLDIQPLEQIWQWTRPDGQLHLTWWRARLHDPQQNIQMNQSEVAEARWVTPDEFRQLKPILENNLQLMDHYTINR